MQTGQVASDAPKFVARATPERLAKLDRRDVEITPPAVGAPKGTQRLSEAPLDQLWKRRIITEREFNAGDRLRGDHYLAGLNAMGSVDLNRTGGSSLGRAPSMFNSQTVADARIRFRRTRQGIGGVVWDVLNLGILLEKDLAFLGRELFSVRRHEQREQYAAGAAGLRVALGALADWNGT